MSNTSAGWVTKLWIHEGLDREFAPLVDCSAALGKAIKIRFTFLKRLMLPCGCAGGSTTVDIYANAQVCTYKLDFLDMSRHSNDIVPEWRGCESTSC